MRPSPQHVVYAIPAFLVIWFLLGSTTVVVLIIVAGATWYVARHIAPPAATPSPIPCAPGSNWGRSPLGGLPPYPDYTIAAPGRVGFRYDEVAVDFSALFGDGHHDRQTEQSAIAAIEHCLNGPHDGTVHIGHADISPIFTRYQNISIIDNKPTERLALTTITSEGQPITVEHTQIERKFIIKLSDDRGMQRPLRIIGTLHTSTHAAVAALLTFEKIGTERDAISDVVDMHTRLTPSISTAAITAITRPAPGDPTWKIAITIPRGTPKHVREKYAAAIQNSLQKPNDIPATVTITIAK